MKIAVETITPAQAKAYLLHNTKNRTLHPKRVSIMAADMRMGAWVVNGDTIRFDVEGTLVDGQHRLSACVTSGVPLTVIVVRDLDVSAFMAMGKENPRSLGDMLSILGYKDGVRLGAAAKVFYGLSAGYPTSMISKSYNKMSHTQAAMVVELVPGLITWLQRFQSTSEFSAVRAGPECLYVALAEATSQEDPELADSFWESVMTGTDLYKGHPAKALRNKMLRERMATHGASHHWQWVGWAISAWNAHRKGRMVNRLLIKNKVPQKIIGWDAPDLSCVFDPKVKPTSIRGN